MDQKITPQSTEHDRQERPDDALIQKSGPSEGGAPSTTETGSKGADGPDAHGIFDERFAVFTDAFGATCEQEHVRTAIAIVSDPKLPREPIVFMRGNEYDVAKLLAALLRRINQDILRKITP